MSLPYITAGWETAKPCSPLIGEAPFAGDPNEYIFRQMYYQRGSTFKRLPLGTRYPGDETMYLVGEGTPTSQLGHDREWERVYARIPERRKEIGEVTAIEEFPDEERGIFRNEKSKPSQIFYDYFYAPGQTYLDIPIFSAEKLVVRNGQVATIGGGMITLSGSAVAESMIRPIPLYSPGGIIQIRKILEDSTVGRWMGEIYVRETKTLRVFIASGVGYPR